MTEAEKRLHRCCFTGHRPEKIYETQEAVTQRLEFAIRGAIQDDKTVFIVGMAPGVDIIAGEIVIRLRDEEKLPIKLITAEPYAGFDKRWSMDWQRRYAYVLDRSDYPKIVCQKKSTAAYQIRNEWMVDHSALVIAYYNGASGGTRNTMVYAKKKNVPVWNIAEKLIT